MAADPAALTIESLCSCEAVAKVSALGPLSLWWATEGGEESASGAADTTGLAPKSAKAVAGMARSVAPAAGKGR